MFLERTPDFLCRAWLVFEIGFRFWFKNPTPIPFEGVESFLVFCAWRVRLPGSATPRPEAFRRVWFSGASGLPACLCLRVCVCVCVSASAVPAVPAVRVCGVAWGVEVWAAAWRGVAWRGACLRVCGSGRDIKNPPLWAGSGRGLACACRVRVGGLCCVCGRASWQGRRAWRAWRVRRRLSCERKSHGFTCELCGGFGDSEAVEVVAHALGVVVHSGGFSASEQTKR